MQASGQAVQRTGSPADRQATGQEDKRTSKRIKKKAGEVEGRHIVHRNADKNIYMSPFNQVNTRKRANRKKRLKYKQGGGAERQKGRITERSERLHCKKTSTKKKKCRKAEI